uniref:Uncharacterized protein n=1 Tax=Neobodo designis TaxID=312471 RepID=A0A7S1W7M8_NEODS
MGPKKAAEPAPPVEAPQELDPSVIAAREAMDRQHAEDRKAFERGELEARRRVEALEAVSAKCVVWEKERRLNPASSEKRTQAAPGTEKVFIKLLTGNRAVPQQTYEFPFEADMTMGALKKKIFAAAGERGATRALRGWFAPANQTLMLSGKELGAPEEEPVSEPAGTPRAPPGKEAAAAPQQPPPPTPPADPNASTLSALKVYPGATLHLALRTPEPTADMIPSKLK